MLIPLSTSNLSIPSEQLVGSGRNWRDMFFQQTRDRSVRERSFCVWSNSAWSKHWHAGRMRPANAFCMPCITRSHKCIVLATHHWSAGQCFRGRPVARI